MNVVIVIAAVLAIFLLWFWGIWIGHEARRGHMPPDGHKESSGP